MTNNDYDYTEPELTDDGGSGTGSTILKLLALAAFIAIAYFAYKHFSKKKDSHSPSHTPGSSHHIFPLGPSVPIVTPCSSPATITCHPNQKLTCEDNKWSCPYVCGPKPTCPPAQDTTCDATTKKWSPCAWVCGPAPSCPPKTTPSCDPVTKKWSCPSVCGTPPSCPPGTEPECDTTKKPPTWHCTAPPPPPSCSADPPTNMQCPPSSGGTSTCVKMSDGSYNCGSCDKTNSVQFKLWCGKETDNKWRCDPQCCPANSPAGLQTSCPTGKVGACTASNGYAWGCFPESENVCGSTSKPTCAGVMCWDQPVDGWTWVCPGSLTRQQIIDHYLLHTKVFPSPASPGGSVELVCTDLACTQPVAPSVGADCASTASQWTGFGKDIENVLANPKGNICNDTSVCTSGEFVPFNDGQYLYYEAEAGTPGDPAHYCMFTNPCENGGKFIQDQKDVSKTGHCSCVAPWVGSSCQYSPSTTCSGHGTVSATGTCTCTSPWMGDHCQVDSTTKLYYSTGQSVCGMGDDDCNPCNPGSAKQAGDTKCGGCYACSEDCEGGCANCWETPATSPLCFDGHKLTGKCHYTSCGSCTTAVRNDYCSD